MDDVVLTKNLQLVVMMTQIEDGEPVLHAFKRRKFAVEPSDASDRSKSSEINRQKVAKCTEGSTETAVLRSGLNEISAIMFKVRVTSLCAVIAIYILSTTALRTEVKEEWPGSFKGIVRIPIDEDVRDGWTVEIVFNKRVRNLQIWQAAVIRHERFKHYYLRNNDWNARLDAGSELNLEFIGNIGGRRGAIGEVTFNKIVITPPPSPPGQEPDLVNCSAFTMLSVLDEWQQHFKGKVEVTVTSALTNGWSAVLSFSKPVRNLQIWTARIERTENHNRIYYLRNEQWNADLPVGTKYEAQFIGQVQGSAASFSFRLENQLDECDCGPDAEAGCSLAPPVTTSAPPSTTTTPLTTKVQPVTTTVPTVATTVKPVSTTAPKQTTKTYSTMQTTLTTNSQSTIFDTTESSGESFTDEPSTTFRIPFTEGPYPYNYPEVLHKSILFYEAQRSGYLPASNRISYRGDSATTDGHDIGVDLTGGWYDAGDFVKFGFPMASSATVLGWGLVEFEDAYRSAGELENMLDSLKWATDYFIKCHVGSNQFYAQVGDGHIDHAYWGRPEEMNLNRPAFKVDQANPGSDVAAETAAALAAASIAFRRSGDPVYVVYADELLQHAEELFRFADSVRGVYSDYLTNAADFYRSSGFKDELAWSAVWLYRATGNLDYLQQAEAYYENFGLDILPWAFSWDDKTAGVQVLLLQATRKSKYYYRVQQFIQSWKPENGFTYTPGGLAWRDQWGSNRYAANSALIAIMAAKEGVDILSNLEFARQQIHYMLGDSGRSFVVGFGSNPPNAPHHRSSSCPDNGPCDWTHARTPGPNPQVLYGALVGGPDINGNFVNDRTDYIRNEVACDYNAGFQSAVAGLMQLHQVQLNEPLIPSISDSLGSFLP